MVSDSPEFSQLFQEFFFDFFHAFLDAIFLGVFDAWLEFGVPKSGVHGKLMRMVGGKNWIFNPIKEGLHFVKTPIGLAKFLGRLTKLMSQNFVF